jgi:hypothetical protein
MMLHFMKAGTVFFLAEGLNAIQAVSYGILNNPSEVIRETCSSA